jgi:hypothetical protein
MASPAVLIFKSKESIPGIFTPSESVLGIEKCSLKLYSKFGFKFALAYRDTLKDLKQSFKDKSTFWVELYGYRDVLLFVNAINLSCLNFKVFFKILFKMLRGQRSLLIRYVNFFVTKSIEEKKYHFEVNSGDVFINNKATVLSIDNYEELRSDKRCYFASFSSNSKIEDYVVEYLKQIRGMGFDIVFVTTSENVNDKDRLKGIVNILIHRKNIGHDFGSWVTGVKLFPNNTLEKVLIANDSVLGPVGSLKEIFSDKMDQYDVYGATCSSQIEFHLQSYFVFFGKNIIQSGDFQKFWDEYTCVLIKDLVVFTGEIAITRFFRMKGYSIGSLVEDRGGFHLLTPRINPMHSYWREMILDFNVPFIKNSLINMSKTNKHLKNEIQDVLKEKQPNLLSMLN